MLVYVLLKTRNQAFSRRSCAKTGKKCIKKHDARAKLFYLSNVLCLMTFSLPSSNLDLKVPINHDDDNSDNAEAKQQLCTCIRLFLVIQFFDVYCTTTATSCSYFIYSLYIPGAKLFIFLDSIIFCYLKRTVWITGNFTLLE